MDLQVFFLALLLAPPLLTVAICSYSYEIGAKFRLTDHPDGVRKLHAKATPLVGGIAVLVPTFLSAAALSVFFDPPAFLPPAVVASTLILFLGAIDDRFEVSAFLRLASFTVAAFVLIFLQPMLVLHALNMNLLGYAFAIVFDPFANLATLVIVVGFVSASNMADGMNGQLLGSVVIWSLFLCFYLAGYAGMTAGLPYIVLALTSAVAFFFNLRGRLFSGSAGSYGASLFIAASAIAAYDLSGGKMPASIPMFWFYLPVIDCLRLMTWRALQGRSPFSPDRNHFHHVLQGFHSPPSALVVYLVMLALPGLAALVDNDLAWASFGLCCVTYTAILLRQKAEDFDSARAKA